MARIDSSPEALTPDNRSLNLRPSELFNLISCKAAEIPSTKELASQLQAVSFLALSIRDMLSNKAFDSSILQLELKLIPEIFKRIQPHAKKYLAAVSVKEEGKDLQKLLTPILQDVLDFFSIRLSEDSYADIFSGPQKSPIRFKEEKLPPRKRK